MKESPIFTKTYDLLLWLMPATIKFPREQRFVLARAVQETALRFQERLIEAGVSQGRTRTHALTQADVELTKLRFYLRLCQDMKLLSSISIAMWLRWWPKWDGCWAAGVRR